MASVKKGDGKEETIEPRSTSVWEVGKNFPIIFQFKEYDREKSSSNERCQGGRVTFFCSNLPSRMGVNEKCEGKFEEI